MWLRVDLVYSLPRWTVRSRQCRSIKACEKMFLILVIGSFYMFCISPLINRNVFQATEHNRYCVVYNFTQAKQRFRPAEATDSEPITLALHTSVDFFANIFEQVSTWDGAISLSLYLEKDLGQYAAFFHRIHTCDVEVGRKVSLHLVFERAFFDETCREIYVPTVSCADYNRAQVLETLSRMDRPSMVYPINVMRNIARKGASSTLHLVSDIEMVFSEKAASLLTPLANSIQMNQRKIALVIRRFEIESQLAYPRNVAQLNDMFYDKTAIEFHSLIFAKGHSIPYIWAWFNRSMEEEHIAANRLSYLNSYWEPQVLINADAPYHDETIPTRHRDHQALVYELCRAGYRFFVATKVFNVHRGIKRRVTWLDKEVERLGQEQNEIRGRLFYRRLNLLYPGTFTKCARWNPVKEIQSRMTERDILY